MNGANSSYIKPERPEAERGMLIRGEDTIRAGSLVFRFVNDATAAFKPGRLSSSGWWWGLKSVRRAVIDSTKEDLSIQDIVRSNGAIIDAFANACDVLLIAAAKVNLEMYWGVGKAVGGKLKYGAGPIDGRSVTSIAYGDVGIPDPDYEQWYIPGIKIGGQKWLEYKTSLHLSTFFRSGGSLLNFLQKIG